MMEHTVNTLLAQATPPDDEITLLGDPIDYVKALTFLHPMRLWWLLGLLALAVLYFIMQWRRKGLAVRFTNVELLDKVAPDRLNWTKHIPSLLFLLGLAVGIFTYAEPQTVVSVPSERATIIMAIDTSLSMMAEDVDPSRIDGAKIAAQDFVAQLPADINIGLVSFNGIATIRNAPTQNHTAVQAAITDLQLGPATAIGEAIYASLQSINDMLPDESGDLPPARIVLMSDGKTTVGRPDVEAVEAARQAGIPISTIAFGTESGTIVLPEFPDRIEPVPVDYEALSIIADGTGGQFFRAATTDELREVYADIGSSIGFDQEMRPVVGPLIALALLLLVAAWLSSLFWRVSLPS